MSPEDSMTVTPCDERDTDWEDDAPVFRVYVVWDPSADGPGAAATYDLRGCDVRRAVEWAEDHAPDGAFYAVGVVSDRRGAPGLADRGVIWVLGTDLVPVAPTRREGPALPLPR